MRLERKVIQLHLVSASVLCMPMVGIQYPVRCRITHHRATSLWFGTSHMCFQFIRQKIFSNPLCLCFFCGTERCQNKDTGIFYTGEI